MQVTLNIPDDKIGFFMQLVENLGFESIQTTSPSHPLTQLQMQLIDDEVRKAAEDPAYLLDFDTAWKSLRVEE